MNLLPWFRRTGSMYHQFDIDMSHPLTQKLPTHPGEHFDLVTHWRLHAPVENVWAVLMAPESWPMWWPHVRAVRTLEPGGSTAQAVCAESIGRHACLTGLRLRSKPWSRSGASAFACARAGTWTAKAFGY